MAPRDGTFCLSLQVGLEQGFVYSVPLISHQFPETLNLAGSLEEEWALCGLTVQLPQRW